MNCVHRRLRRLSQDLSFFDLHRSSSIPRAPASSFKVLSLDFPRFLLAFATPLEYPRFLDFRTFIDLRLIAVFPALFVDLRDQASISRVFYPGSSASSIFRVFHAGVLVPGAKEVEQIRKSGQNTIRVQSLRVMLSKLRLRVIYA